MKKFLFPLLLLTTLASGQSYSRPDFTTSLGHAVNCFVDSSVTKSSTGVLRSRIVNTYDANFKLVTKYHRNFLFSQSEFDTYTYDSNDSVVKKTHAIGASAPTQTVMTRMTRNSAKQVVLDTVLNTSGSQFTLTSANSYTYDASGYVIQALQYDYNGSWALKYRTQYLRSSAGKILNQLLQTWVINKWENVAQDVMTYNSNNDVTNHVLQYWIGSGSSASWLNDRRWTYTYTGTHLDTYTNYLWNNGWIDQDKYIYSPAGPQDMVTKQSWNGSQWSNATRYIRNWSQGLMTSVVEQDDNNNQWEDKFKNDYTYDGLGNNILTEGYSYIAGANPWSKFNLTTHDYSCYAIVVGADEESRSQNKVYPVPSAGVVYIESQVPVMNGVVMNTSGQVIVEFEGSSVDLSLVEAGVYFLTVNYNDGSRRIMKVIKE